MHRIRDQTFYLQRKIEQNRKRESRGTSPAFFMQKKRRKQDDEL